MGARIKGEVARRRPHALNTAETVPDALPEFNGPFALLDNGGPSINKSRWMDMTLTRGATRNMSQFPVLTGDEAGLANRRSFLRVGGMFLGGLSLPQLLAAEQAAGRGSPKKRSS
jgi:hypothetical protein